MKLVRAFLTSLWLRFKKPRPLPTIEHPVEVLHNSDKAWIVKIQEPAFMKETIVRPTVFARWKRGEQIHTLTTKAALEARSPYDNLSQEYIYDEVIDEA